MAEPTYIINSGDTAWVLVCASFVFLMSPALGFFYAGLARAKNALSLMYLTVLSVAVVSVQWYLLGFSLTFSNTGGPFIGDSAHFLLRGVGQAPLLESQTIPASAFMIFQAMFACITPALAFGSAAERMSLGPATLFVFVWTTLVYDVITYWVWASNGWLAKLGVMDYAGGTPVHISSGLAAVAYAMVLGKRRDYNENVNTPHNVSFVFLGLALMWFGWFAFNAGSALAANARSVNSLVCTHLSGCIAAIVWVCLDYRRSRKWSIVGLCTGAVAGLATVTPASGFVSPSSSLALGAVGSLVCNIMLTYKHKYRFDDALDVFAVHYIGGLVGLVLTGIFAQQSVIALGYPDGTPLSSIPRGGWLDGNWMQVPIQLAAIGSVSAWSFVVTYIILEVINKIPYLKLRLNDEAEVIGTDWSEMGERAYAYLPFEDDQSTPPRRSSGSVDRIDKEAQQLENVSEIQEQHQQHPQQQSSPGQQQRRRGDIRKMILGSRHRTVVQGVPDLVEEPVEIDFGKGAASYHMKKMTTGRELYEKSAAMQRGEEQERGSVNVDGHPMATDVSSPLGNSQNSSNTTVHDDHRGPAPTN